MKTKTYIGIIAIAAVAIGLIGFFLNWIQFPSTGETGWDTIFQDGGTYTLYAAAMFMALIGCAIFLLTEIKGVATGGIKFLTVLLSAIILVCAVLMFFDLERLAGTGLFMEIAAGAILFTTSIAFALMK